MEREPSGLAAVPGVPRGVKPKKLQLPAPEEFEKILASIERPGAPENR